ncbi:hypothetical protein HDU86_001680, partial [Geranomyces michiganensis]
TRAHTPPPPEPRDIKDVVNLLRLVALALRGSEWKKLLHQLVSLMLVRRFQLTTLTLYNRLCVL